MCVCVCMCCLWVQQKEKQAHSASVKVFSSEKSAGLVPKILFTHLHSSALILPCLLEIMTDLEGQFHVLCLIKAYTVLLFFFCCTVVHVSELFKESVIGVVIKLPYSRILLLTTTNHDSIHFWIKALQIYSCSLL